MKTITKADLPNTFFITHNFKVFGSELKGQILSVNFGNKTRCFYFGGWALIEEEGDYRIASSYDVCLMGKTLYVYGYRDYKYEILSSIYPNQSEAKDMLKFINKYSLRTEENPDGQIILKEEGVILTHPSDAEFGINSIPFNGFSDVVISGSITNTETSRADKINFADNNIKFLTRVVENGVEHCSIKLAPRTLLL